MINRFALRCGALGAGSVRARTAVAVAVRCASVSAQGGATTRGLNATELRDFWRDGCVVAARTAVCAARALPCVCVGVWVGVGVGVAVWQWGFALTPTPCGCHRDAPIAVGVCGV